MVLVTALSAQTTTGRISGRVTDESGASVPNVKVNLTNEATGVGRDTNTNESGDYSFLEVPVGDYTLTFDVSGFQKNIRKNVTVQLNQVLTLNTTLKVGIASEVIDVSSEAPLVDTTTTQLGAVVGAGAVSNLPLNARDTYQLLQLQPGVQGVGGTDLFFGSNQAGAVSVNGGRGRANNFSVNGGDGNDLFVNGPAIQPSPDSIQEFRVLTNTFDAEYGRNSGAVINVVTKSGTNNFHGNVYEFFRNKALNAKAYLDPFKADNKQNVFGGTFGGPVKKDRTFFFGSYEGRRNIQGFSSDPVFVPTAAQRAGNFSDTPFTGTLNSPIVAAVLQQRCGALLGTTPAVGSNWSDIFPNSVIPTQCMDPVALDLMNRFVPLPNQGGNVWQDVPIGRTRDDQFTAKVDHKLTDKQSLNIYYYFIDTNQRQPFTRFEALTPNLLPGFGNQSLIRNQQWNVAHTWTLGPSAVNQFRFTYFREAQGTFLHPQHTNLVTSSCSSSVSALCFTGTTDTPNLITPDPKLGITPNLGPNHEGVPFVQIFGGFTIGNDYEGELPQIGNTFQWSDNFTKVAGKHTLKFGGDVRRMRFDQMLFFDPNGDYSFTGGSSSLGAGNLFPDFLMGLPSSYLQGSAQQEHVRTTAVYLFGQDSWKLKPNLTLNYGLRWELNTPLTDIGRRVQTFRPGQVDNVFPCALSPSNPLASTYGSTDCSPSGPAAAVFPTGLVIPGDPGVPGGLTQTYYKSFAPRIGLAWSPNWNNALTGGPGKTSIRMGYGIFYNPVEQLVLEQFQGEPPFGGSSLITEGLFSTPFVLQSCDPTSAPCSTSNGSAPNPFNGILDPKRGTPVDWSVFRPILLFGELQPKIRSQYSEQYNLTIQRELT
ncbi:MAG: TonB-dependent receptor, partial [Acidobacteriaceae bacterium]|nr:TonB-dependent receptor [Acidobacteriaceae bacterium]